MTDKQQEALNDAVAAFIAARVSGVEEFHLIGDIFNASNKFTTDELKAGRPVIQKPLIELVQEKQRSSS